MDILNRLIDAVAASDAPAIDSCLAPDVRLRALLPGGAVEAHGREAARAEMKRWFEGLSARLVERAVEPVADRWRLVYRVADTLADGTACLCDQSAFVDIGEDGIEAIDLLCSGDRPISTREATTHRFAAEGLGCADGLAQEFRRRIRAVDVGDRLEVTADDPAAREELPSLARLMGHTVSSVETLDDGRLLITVERTR